MLGIELNGATRLVQPWWPAEATYAVDFTTGHGMRDGIFRTMSELISCTRASSRLAIDSRERWHRFGPNIPAITDLGLSLEPAATNLIIDNAGLASTNLTGITVSPWQFDDCPQRGGNAQRLTQGNGAGDAFFRLLPLAGGVTYTASRFYKYDSSSTWIRMSISDNVAHGYFAYLNLATMSLGIAASFGIATILDCQLTQGWNGWYRLSLTGVLPNSTMAGGFFSHSVAGNGNTTRVAGSYGIWGDQVVAGPQSHSPIITNDGQSHPSDQVAALVESAKVCTIHYQGGRSEDLSVEDGMVDLSIPSPAGVIVKIAAF